MQKIIPRGGDKELGEINQAVASVVRHSTSNERACTWMVRGKGDRQEDPEIGRPPNTWRQPGARVGRRPGRTGDRARGMLASDGAASRCTGTHACAHPGGAPAFCAGRWPSVNSAASLRAPATPSECMNSPVSSALHTEGLTFPSGTVCILMLLCSSPMQAAASYFESSERFRS